MAIALFGATGRTGKLVLQTARKRGWPVRALVRDPSKLHAAHGLVVERGDARDAAAVGRVVEGSGAVVCALGMADISLPATDFSDSLKAIVGAMQQHRVRRIVAIASAGVLDHPAGGVRNQHGFPDWMANISAEHRRNLETLRASGLDWTLMCPAMLVDEAPGMRTERADEDAPSGSGETSTTGLARAICDVLADRKSFGKRIGIVSFRDGDQAP
jgi:putative NADH-flavin reductase